MDWLSVADIAKTTRIPAPTARRYASLFREYLPSKRVGRVTKYSQDAVAIFERIAQQYAQGHVTSEIEEMLKHEYARTIDVDAGPAASAASSGSAAPDPAMTREWAESFSRLMEKFSSCLEIIANQKALIEDQRDDIQKLKTAFILLARSQKKLRLTPAAIPALPPEAEDRWKNLEAKDKELEEMTLSLSFDNSDMKVKLQILESELIRLRKDRREMEKYLQEKIDRLKA